MAVTPCADEVAEVGAEYGGVPTSLWRQALAAPVLVSHPYTLVSGTVLVRRIVSIARLFVVSIDAAHLVVATLHLTDQLTVQTIEIEVHKAVAVAGQKDVLVGKLDAADGFVLDVAGHLILDDHLTLRGQRISHIDAKAILMTIHRIDGNALRIAGHDDTRNIAVGIDGHLQLVRLTTGDIVRPHRAG